MLESISKEGAMDTDEEIQEQEMDQAATEGGEATKEKYDSEFYEDIGEKTDEETPASSVEDPDADPLTEQMTDDTLDEEK